MTEFQTSDHQLDPTYDETLDGDLVEGFDPEVAFDLGITGASEPVVEQLERPTRTEAELQALIDAAEHEALNRSEGVVKCGTCNIPGCNGCGRS